MTDIYKFKHYENRDVLLQLANFLAEQGFVTDIRSGYWAFRMKNPDTDESVAIREVQKVYLKHEVKFMNEILDGIKVIIIHFEREDFPRGHLWVTTAANLGIGVYSPLHGWVVVPGDPESDEVDPMLAALAPEYVLRSGEIPRKYCAGCGELLPVTEFYKKSYRASRPKDPYRPRCKKCYK